MRLRENPQEQNVGDGLCELKCIYRFRRAIAAHNPSRAATAVKKTIRATPINIPLRQPSRWKPEAEPNRRIIVRFLLLSLALPAVLSAQDPLEIVRRATELDRRNTEISRSYTYLERQEQRDMDSSGRLKKSESTTFDVTLLEGSPYRRMVARNDQPLSPKDQRKEEERLQHSIADRSQETPEQRERRAADWDRKRQKQREPIREMADAFTFTMAGEETLNGGETWVIDAAPKPGYRPKGQSTAFFPKVKLRLWIAKNDSHWVKIDMESLDTITFGGFLIRMAKGSHLTAENARINNEVWLPKRAALKGSVRIALVKVLRGELIFTFNDYKKFQTDSRIVGGN